MPNKKYQKGYRGERKAITELKKIHNCQIAFRTPASKGLLDVIGISMSSAITRIFILEVKNRKDPKPRKKEIDKIKWIPKGANVWIGLWCWNTNDQKFDKHWL